jgi:hypothetical protein
VLLRGDTHPGGDIGWHPEFDLSGKFLIHIIENGDWDEPLLISRVSFDDFYIFIEQIIHIIERLENSRKL